MYKTKWINIKLYLAWNSNIFRKTFKIFQNKLIILENYKKPLKDTNFGQDLSDKW